MELWTHFCIIMEILEKTLFPFISDVHVYPVGRRLMADNDPKHTSGAVQQFVKDNDVYW